MQKSLTTQLTFLAMKRVVGRSTPFAILPILLLFNTVSAGPWTIPKGEFYLSYNAIYTHFDEVVAADESRLNVGDVQILNHSLSLDYGLTDYWNVNITIPYVTTTLGPSTANAGDYDGLGDGQFSLKYRFLDQGLNPITAACSLGFKVPLSDYPTDRFSTIGDNQVDVELRILLGRTTNWFGRLFYFNLEGGYRWRGDETDDELFGFYEVGTMVTQRLTFRVFAEHVDQLGGIEVLDAEFNRRTAATGEFPLPIIEQNYFLMGLGFSYQLTESLDAGLFIDKTLWTDGSSFDEHVGLSVGIKF